MNLKFHYHVPKSCCVVLKLNHISSMSLLILSSHLRLGFSSGLFSAGFLPENFACQLFIIFPMRATCPAHLIFFALITLDLAKSTKHEAPHYFIPPSARYFLSLRSRYSPRHLVISLNILSLCSHVRMRHQVAHPYIITDKTVIVLTSTCFR
jgi:hypothetical protein